MLSEPACEIQKLYSVTTPTSLHTIQGAAFDTCLRKVYAAILEAYLDDGCTERADECTPDKSPAKCDVTVDVTGQ